MSDSLQPLGLQHARLPCLSPTPRACSNSCPSSWWCYLAISSSVVPFSSYLQSFSAAGSFPMCRFFASGGQRIGASASASVLNEYSRLTSFRIDWFDLLAVQGMHPYPSLFPSLALLSFWSLAYGSHSIICWINWLFVLFHVRGLGLSLLSPLPSHPTLHHPSGDALSLLPSAFRPVITSVSKLRV